MKALVVKNISNQYEVLTSDGQRLLATPLGKLKRKGRLIVGDYVEIEKQQDRYIIKNVQKRRNQLVRPSVCNIDQAIVVMSAIDPDFSTALVDRLLFMIQYEEITPIIYVSKLDLLTQVQKDELTKVLDDYQQSGYLVITELTDLLPLLKNKISVLCGQSGAGKSTLLNKLNPDLELKTQITSKALGRGKHTTRHCELYLINDGLLADTPGFSSLELNMDPQILASRVLDFKDHLGNCRFRDCKHINEPDCEIKKLVADKKISEIRYKNYVNYVESLNKRRM